MGHLRMADVTSSCDRLQKGRKVKRAEGGKTGPEGRGNEAGGMPGQPVKGRKNTLWMDIAGPGPLAGSKRCLGSGLFPPAPQAGPQPSQAMVSWETTLRNPSPGPRRWRGHWPHLPH